VSALLQIDDLSVAISATPLLLHLTLRLERGEILGLVGESGSGKSLTALAIMGLLPACAVARGRILFDGADLLALDEPALCGIRGRRIAMVFQEPATALNPVRSIGAQVAEGMRLHLRLGRAERDARARALLERVGLPACRFPPSLYPHQLSGGQRQRVVIAIALACAPDLLIADEPTTALDLTVQAQILDLLGDLVAERGMALLLITHDLGVVADIAGRVAVMYSGRVVESGPTGAVFAAMAHPYTHGLFAAAVRDLGPGGRLAAIPGVVPSPAQRPPGCAFAPRCPRVAADCRAEPPPLRPLAPAHAAACLHPR
jgi:peptide/nickel transport system ATP-binding protein